MYLAIGFTIFPLMLMLFPIWMGLTGVDSAQPGMRGHFYFTYCYFFSYHTLSAAVMMFLVLKSKAAGRVTTGSQNNEGTKMDSNKGKVESNNGNFASFTVDELNANSSP